MTQEQNPDILIADHLAALMACGGLDRFGAGLLEMVKTVNESALNLGLESGIRMGYDAAITMLEEPGAFPDAVLSLKAFREHVLAASAASVKEASQDDGA